MQWCVMVSITHVVVCYGIYHTCSDVLWYLSHMQWCVMVSITCSVSWYLSHMQWCVMVSILHMQWCVMVSITCSVSWYLSHMQWCVMVSILPTCSGVSWYLSHVQYVVVSITHVVACQVYHTCSGVSCYLCPQTPNLILWMMGVGSDTLSGTGVRHTFWHCISRRDVLSKD